MNDVRFAYRQLLKNPGFTAVAVLTLALGIGATSSVFSLIQGVLLTPPPYRHPEQVVLIRMVRVDGQPTARGCTKAQWLEWQKDATSFEALAGYSWGFDFLVLPDRSESVQGMFVTTDVFQALGVQPLFGRTFLATDAPPRNEEPTVVILGYDLWQRTFRGDSNILGKTVRLSLHPPRTVIGVMPPNLRFLPSPRHENLPNYQPNAHVDFWVPAWPEETKAEDALWNVVGRLRNGATLTQAQAELTAIAARQAQHDRDLAELTAKAELLTTSVNREARRLLVPLAGAVGFVFLIACGNVAGLLLARGFQRQQDFAVRCALGAGRWQLFRQAFTEGFLLALLGAVLGAGLAAATVKALKSVAGVAIPRLDAVTIDGSMLAFCFGSASLAAVLAGLVPAFRAARLDPASVVKGGGPRSSTSRTDRQLLAGVAMIQMALTLALLVGAGLLIRTVNNLARIRPGYETQNILAMSVTQVRHAQHVEGMEDNDHWARRFVDFHRRALAEVSELPGVRSAAFAWGVPLTGNKWLGTIQINETTEPNKSADEIAVPMRAVSPEYFDTLSLQILQGRNFRSREAFSWPPAFTTNVPNVAIINQSMMERYFPHGNPMGKTFRFSFENIRATAEIVGMASNSRSEALTQKPEPEIYFSYWQLPAGTKHLVVRTVTDARSFLGRIQRQLRALDPTVVIEDTRTFEQIRSDSIAPRLFVMRLLVGFSLAACVLALVSVYGVLALSVASRRREIAIRMAVGATPHTIHALVLREGMRLIVISVFFGIVIALALGRVVTALLFGIEPTDPVTLIGVTLPFIGVAMLSCWVPSRRAAKVEPVEALRYE